MPKKGHGEEQILRALRQAESGTKVSEICHEATTAGDKIVIYVEESA